MAVRKTAIAIPEELLAEVDQAAEERGDSRSGYITRLLRMAVRARRDAEVTRRLNEFFAHVGRAEDLGREAEEWAQAGTDWKNERW
jgi:hypothetical protein